MNYKGKGNHSVFELEDIVEALQEENHYRQIKLQKLQKRSDDLASVLTITNGTLKEWLYSRNPGTPSTHDITDMIESHERFIYSELEEDS